MDVPRLEDRLSRVLHESPKLFVIKARMKVKKPLPQDFPAACDTHRIEWETEKLSQEEAEEFVNAPALARSTSSDSYHVLFATGAPFEKNDIVKPPRRTVPHFKTQQAILLIAPTRDENGTPVPFSTANVSEYSGALSVRVEQCLPDEVERTIGPEKDRKAWSKLVALSKEELRSRRDDWDFNSRPFCVLNEALQEISPINTQFSDDNDDTHLIVDSDEPASTDIASSSDERPSRAPKNERTSAPATTKKPSKYFDDLRGVDADTQRALRSAGPLPSLSHYNLAIHDKVSEVPSYEVPPAAPDGIEQCDNATSSKLSSPPSLVSAQDSWKTELVAAEEQQQYEGPEDRLTKPPLSRARRLRAINEDIKCLNDSLPSAASVTLSDADVSVVSTPTRSPSPLLLEHANNGQDSEVRALNTATSVDAAPDSRLAQDAAKFLNSLLPIHAKSHNGSRSLSANPPPTTVDTSRLDVLAEVAVHERNTRQTLSCLEAVRKTSYIPPRMPFSDASMEEDSDVEIVRGPPVPPPTPASSSDDLMDVDEPSPCTKRATTTGKRRAVPTKGKKSLSTSTVSDDDRFPDIQPYTRLLDLHAIPQSSQVVVYKPISPPIAPRVLINAAHTLTQLAQSRNQTLREFASSFYNTPNVARPLQNSDLAPFPRRSSSPRPSSYAMPSFLTSASSPPTTSPFSSLGMRGRSLVQKPLRGRLLPALPDHSITSELRAPTSLELVRYNPSHHTTASSQARSQPAMSSAQPVVAYAAHDNRTSHSYAGTSTSSNDVYQPPARRVLQAALTSLADRRARVQGSSTTAVPAATSSIAPDPQRHIVALATVQRNRHIATVLNEYQYAVQTGLFEFLNHIAQSQESYMQWLQAQCFSNINSLAAGSPYLFPKEERALLWCWQFWNMRAHDPRACFRRNTIQDVLLARSGTLQLDAYLRGLRDSFQLGEPVIINPVYQPPPRDV
ncbi:hypothetical protein PHLGIDRAFT_123453 [Phlebiopsis gigantea 11061_1 CR5-6]|uniref:Uncharacterized protein n=1 Tax=Phlebiopsis gigantea (strain 11061_1 CR5-6) TaxID=745531 RepID=A0A0C3P9I6_PHLG1|nr:hypothetical protein PHLGIDRAFT_123453 [Phlebiopsis gigantea 11061_1 CR5-6]